MHTPTFEPSLLDRKARIFLGAYGTQNCHCSVVVSVLSAGWDVTAQTVCEPQCSEMRIRTGLPRHGCLALSGPTSGHFVAPEHSLCARFRVVLIFGLSFIFVVSLYIGKSKNLVLTSAFPRPESEDLFASFVRESRLIKISAAWLSLIFANRSV